MDINSLYTVLITAITVLGSTSAWKFYEKRVDAKKDEDNFIKQDCRERITKLEVLLKESSSEKDKMRETILGLTEKVSALSVKVEFLQKENVELISRLKND